MKDVVSEMLKHPFATILIIGAVGSLVAEIISVSRGNARKPFVDVSMSK